VIRFPKRRVLAPEGRWDVNGLLDKYVEASVPFSLSSEFLDGLLKGCRNFRDPSRISRNENLIRDSPVIVRLQRNLLHGPNISFALEIKPKWHGALAYVSPRIDIYSRFASDHFKFCRHCSKKYSKGGLLKPSENSIADSKLHLGQPLWYCPSMLFSANQFIIFEALKILQMDPRNNMRLWIQGKRQDTKRISTSDLQTVSVFLSKDPFLHRLGVLLRILWDPRSEINDRVLIDAACLRDCSFIISGASLQSGNFIVKIIDLDGKDPNGIPRYSQEKKELGNHLDELSSMGHSVEPQCTFGDIL
jgi:hypothetical protein